MSILTVPSLSDGVNTQDVTNIIEKAAAWCLYNQAAGPIISGSFNISSVTDVATGRAQYNYTNVMAQGVYGCQFTGDENRICGFEPANPPITSSVYQVTFNSANGRVDDDRNNLSVHGRLA